MREKKVRMEVANLRSFVILFFIFLRLVFYLLPSSLFVEGVKTKLLPPVDSVHGQSERKKRERSKVKISLENPHLSFILPLLHIFRPVRKTNMSPFF